MRDRYEWQPDEPFEYNLAVQKIPPFADKLYALQEPANYLAVADAWYDDWRDAPGSVMVAPGVKAHEREDALRVDFLPIARYVASYEATVQELRYEHLQAFVVMNTIPSDRRLWADRHGRPYSFSRLLPQAVADIMFTKWIDGHYAHSGAVRILASMALQARSTAAA